MTSVILLAGGDLSQKLKFINFRATSPALIPVNTYPLGFYHLNFYLNGFSDLKVFLVVDNDSYDEVREEFIMFDGRYEIIGISNSGGVVESLKYSLEKIPTSDEIIVNLITTIPTILPEKNEVFISSEEMLSDKWSSVFFEPSTGSYSLIPKSESITKKVSAFTGVFRVDYQIMKEVLPKILDKSDLIEVLKKLPGHCNLSFKKIDWIDCGHENNFYDAKLKLISSRSFNKITTTQYGTLIKKSNNKEKIEQEYSFYKMIPDKLSVNFPRVIDYLNSKSSKTATLELEYYGYPSLSEISLYWDLSLAGWDRFFTKLKEILLCFRREAFSIGMQAFNNFYFEKLKTRLDLYYEQLKRRKDFEWTQKKIIINNSNCLPISELMEEIENRLKGLYNEDHFFVMHGDFCFNNILYDPKSGLVKLIDPRGSFGAKCIGIFGDQKYDLAKLLHSTLGGYDYFVNSLFTLKETDDGYFYSINKRDNFETLVKLSKQLVIDLGYDWKDILLIMATLFISMAPLHSDSEVRQKALYLHGQYLLNNLLLEHENLY